jgi:ATP-dependent DNA helicase RecG
LAILENPTLTQKELAEEVGLSYAGIRYVMDKLKKQGKLKRTGSTKNGQWEITDGLR